MNKFLNKAGKHADLAAAGAVVLVVVMMIIPLPPFLLDLAITLNISAALMIVIATLYVPRALDFSAFPSLLLLTTLFRLAINVSVTRLVLLHGDAGHVVEAFGNFVVGGNVVVGLIIFFILIVIQFVVITNGAGRVAEVGARFTLDAMPGKQMAIDADLNAGQITDEEARKRREEISQEADFYGAMDGASKFVKGDAMAGILITLINLVGGIIIGVMQQGMPFGEAAAKFSLLTVGDGLCAQIPALLISVATGILVTRSASKKDLGNEITDQLLDQRKAPMVAGAVIMGFALIPALPKIPFLLIGGAFFMVGWSLRKVPNSREQEVAELAAVATAAQAPQGELPTPRDAALDALALDPLELAIGFGLVPLVDKQAGGTLLARVATIRRQIASELGMVIPSVRIRDDVALDSHEYVMRVRGTEVARGGIMAGHHLAMDPGDAIGRAAGVPTTEPAFGLPAVWIADAGRAEAEALGYTVVDARVRRRHPPHRDDPRPRRRAAHPPGDAPAARPAQGGQRRRRRRGRPRRALAGRDPARAAVAAARGRLGPRPRRDRRGDRRQGAPHARPGDARRVRPPGARPHDRRARTSTSRARCGRSRWTRRSSRRSPSRSSRRPTASSSPWTRRAPRRSSTPAPSRSSTR